MFFSLIHHTVVIRCSTNVSYGTLCHASGHLGDLPRVLRISERVFYFQVFFTLHSFLLFQGFLGAVSSTSKLTWLHANLRKIPPARQFLWITVIHKLFICGRFCLRARAGQSRNINLHRELVLWNVSFEILASYGIWTVLCNRWARYKSLVITAKPQSLAHCDKLFRINSELSIVVNKSVF